MNEFLKLEQAVSFGEFRDPATGELDCEYCGRFLHDEINGNLILGLCAPKPGAPSYMLGDLVEVSYIDLKRKQKYKVATRVVDVHRAFPEEDFDVGSDMATLLKGNFDVGKYIIKLAMVGRPIENTQREFFRMPLHVKISCEPIPPEKVKELPDSMYSKPIPLDDNKQEVAAGSSREGGFTVITEDISAGGFMFRSSERFENEEYFDCKILVDRAALPAVARVVRRRETSEPGMVMIHLQFHKIGDQVRDRLMGHLIAEQRQMLKIERAQASKTRGTERKGRRRYE